MGKNTAIEWCHHTWNPWWGCTRVSPGCVNCYAETFDRRVHGKEKAHWGVKAERRFFGMKHWNEPVKWNREAERAGERRRVFCASMADVFEDRPELVEHRARLFALIQATPHLDWMLLTKRPENMLRLAEELGWDGAWPANAWAGCTVEDQPRAGERIPELLRVPAAVRFLSCEPLLGPLNLRDYLPHWRCKWCGVAVYSTGINLDHQRCDCGIGAGRWGVRRRGDDRIHLVICGGESGPHARPMHPDWARSLRDQCTAAGVAYFFKQWGEFRPAYPAEPYALSLAPNGSTGDGGYPLVRVGKHAAGRLLDGRTWDEMPRSAMEVAHG
jgi:protein gp37